MKTHKKKIVRALLIVLALVVLLPWHIWVDRFPSGDRSQVWIDGLIYTVVIDNSHYGFNQYSTVALRIPDIYCYRHIGGQTGHISFEIHKGHGVDIEPYHSLIVNIYGGDWWGRPHEYRLGNWCAAPLHQWYTSLLGGD